MTALMSSALITNMKAKKKQSLKTVTMNRALLMKVRSKRLRKVLKTLKKM